MDLEYKRDRVMFDLEEDVKLLLEGLGLPSSNISSQEMTLIDLIDIVHENGGTFKVQVLDKEGHDVAYGGI